MAQKPMLRRSEGAVKGYYTCISRPQAHILPARGKRVHPISTKTVKPALGLFRQYSLWPEEWYTHYLFGLDWTTQALGQQHTSPLGARCEARRRDFFVICGCGNGLARDAPVASKVDGGLKAGGPQGLSFACSTVQRMNKYIYSGPGGKKIKSPFSQLANTSFGQHLASFDAHLTNVRKAGKRRGPSGTRRSRRRGALTRS